ncbi:MAG: hypothetical protein G3M70_07110 [Candidatus Nitronauta litoralis]|uniref:Uncharacterized protein n=1 Tax=Candidatus Nitronauta litoralis TaxID=2705533 RepID=A0A7T0FZX2_9BACT|nr:MAG: hypothetical protein G3M70_07110 [Candidatus Nitronauta litoralis]
MFNLKKRLTDPGYWLYAALIYLLFSVGLLVVTFLDAKAAELTPVKANTQCGTLNHGNGLIENLYDENQDGTPDRFTLTGLDRTSQPRQHPLFYGQDENQDGEWTVWIDRKEDGINGNEEIYQQ